MARRGTRYPPHREAEAGGSLTAAGHRPAATRGFWSVIQATCGSGTGSPTQQLTAPPGLPAVTHTSEQAAHNVEITSSLLLCDFFKFLRQAGLDDLMGLRLLPRRLF